MAVDTHSRRARLAACALLLLSLGSARADTAQDVLRLLEAAPTTPANLAPLCRTNMTVMLERGGPTGKAPALTELKGVRPRRTDSALLRLRSPCEDGAARMSPLFVDRSHRASRAEAVAQCLYRVEVAAINPVMLRTRFEAGDVVDITPNCGYREFDLDNPSALLRRGPFQRYTPAKDARSTCPPSVGGSHVVSGRGQSQSLDGAQSWMMEGEPLSINASVAWRAGATSTPVAVAIMDTGVQCTHEDLKGNMPEWFTAPPAGYGPSAPETGRHCAQGNGFDFVHLTPFPDGCDAGGRCLLHGTEVAGAAGAVAGNGIGIESVARRIPMVSLRVQTASGTAVELDRLIRSMYYAAENGIGILNMSFFHEKDYTEIHRALADIGTERYNGGRGVLIIAATTGGDDIDGEKNKTYPASYQLPNLLPVSALLDERTISSVSGVRRIDVDDDRVIIGAPGSHICTTTQDGRRHYVMAGESSVSAGIVSGAAALVWGQPKFASCTAHQLRNILIRRARELIIGGYTVPYLDLSFLASEKEPGCDPSQPKR